MTKYACSDIIQSGQVFQKGCLSEARTDALLTFPTKRDVHFSPSRHFEQSEKSVPLRPFFRAEREIRPFPQNGMPKGG